MATATESSSARPSALASDQVLKIARLDAEQAYRDLTPYRISLALEKDGWHVDYQLKDPGLNGGGRIISSILPRGPFWPSGTSNKSEPVIGAPRMTADGALYICVMARPRPA